MTSKSFRRFARYALLSATWLFTSPFVPVHAAAQQAQSPPQSEAAPDEPDENQLLIRTDSDLPETYPYEPYHAWLRADGGVPLLHSGASSADEAATLLAFVPTTSGNSLATRVLRSGKPILCRTS